MRRTFVPPNGPPEAKLAIVGEQPGADEIRGNPPRGFIGQAGRALDDCLQMTKTLRSELWISNVIKDLDAPLAHYINLDFKKHKFTISPEGYQYIQELGAELRAMPTLNCVLAFGNVPLIALCNRMGITKWRGSVLESELVPGLKVIPSYHPATIIPPKFNFLNKPIICEDILKAKHESTFKSIKRSPRKIIIHPTFDEAMSYLKYCHEVGLRGATIVFDIEVINAEVDCFSISFTSSESMCIPLRQSQGDYFSPDEELQIMLALAKVIEDDRIAKLNANIIFDLEFIFKKYGIRPRGKLQCTQIAQKISFPDFPAGLDFVTTMHTDIPYYKADGKKWMKMQAGSWEQWWNYNGMDSVAPQEAFPKQQAILVKQNNLDTYERQRKLIEPLIYMGRRGIKVDVQGMYAYQQEQQKRLDELAENLNTEVGHSINYNSPAQLMNYFYKECNIKPYKKKTNDGDYKETSDVDALKRIFRLDVKGSAAARIMLDIRGLSKRISTYLDIGKVDPDGRYRSSYKPVGTETGRISSGETIFDTGGNQNNWPHDLLKFFLFDDGYIGYAFDLSQIENRIVAHVGGVVSQIDAFEQGIDLHRLTASVIFNKPYDLISSKDGSSDLGDGRQSERYWGKKGNHAINYDVGYKTFALKNEMPEGDAKYLIEKIHRGYPQIRSGYHTIIQNMLKKNRTVTNLLGRSRLFLGPVFQDRFTPQSACDNTYREAYAQMAQSTVADKMNEQGIEFVYYRQDLFKWIEILTFIYDSLAFQIPLSLPWIEHAKMLLMIKDSIETPLEWHEREIKTPSDLSIGLNMCKEEMIEFKSKHIPSTPELLAEKLQESYAKLRNAPTDDATN
jgi:uracil-DNA glycosylase family 4